MSKPDAKQRAGDFVVATLIATIVFLSLAGAIRIKPHQTVSEDTSPDAGIFSLTLAPDMSNPQHKQLVKWLEYKDPTHVTLPPEEGLNRDHPSRNWIYRDSEFFGKKSSLPAVNPPLAIQEAYVFETRFPVDPPQDIKKELTQQSLTRINFPAPPPAPPKPAAGIYWLNERSQTVTDIPELDLSSIETDGRQVSGPTYLMVAPLENVAYQPRVSVEVSCGDRELDLIASRHLARWLRRLTVQKSNPLRESWLMTPRKVAVVWMYVPGITYKPSNGILEEPVANDPDAG